MQHAIVIFISRRWLSCKTRGNQHWTWTAWPGISCFVTTTTTKTLQHFDVLQCFIVKTHAMLIHVAIPCLISWLRLATCKLSVPERHDMRGWPWMAAGSGNIDLQTASIVFCDVLWKMQILWISPFVRVKAHHLRGLPLRRSTIVKVQLWLSGDQL